MKKQHTTTRGKQQPADSVKTIEEKIRKRAYELYELRGKEGRHDLVEWLQAESEVRGSADRK